MRNEFTAIVEQDGPWYVAYCAEVPGANGQGKTREECLANLREAITLVLDYRSQETPTFSVTARSQPLAADYRSRIGLDRFPRHWERQAKPPAPPRRAHASRENVPITKIE